MEDKEDTYHLIHPAFTLFAVASREWIAFLIEDATTLRKLLLGSVDLVKKISVVDLQAKR